MPLLSHPLSTPRIIRGDPAKISEVPVIVTVASPSAAKLGWPPTNISIMTPGKDADRATMLETFEYKARLYQVDNQSAYIPHE